MRASMFSGLEWYTITIQHLNQGNEVMIHILKDQYVRPVIKTIIKWRDPQYFSYTCSTGTLATYKQLL